MQFRTRGNEARKKWMARLQPYCTEWIMHKFRARSGERAARSASARRLRRGEDHDLVLGDAIQQGVGLLVQEIPVDAFGPEAGDAPFPAGAFILQRGELRLERDSLGVEFRLWP